jgi:hypothetical protein
MSQRRVLVLQKMNRVITLITARAVLVYMSFSASVPRGLKESDVTLMSMSAAVWARTRACIMHHAANRLSIHRFPSRNLFATALKAGRD